MDLVVAGVKLFLEGLDLEVLLAEDVVIDPQVGRGGGGGDLLLEFGELGEVRVGDCLEFGLELGDVLVFLGLGSGRGVGFDDSLFGLCLVCLKSEYSLEQNLLFIV